MCFKIVFSTYNLLSENYIKRKAGAVCNSGDTWLGYFSSVGECADACREKVGCRFFIFGTGSYHEYCHWERTQTADCTEGWDYYWDDYDFYEITGIICITLSLKLTT